MTYVADGDDWVPLTSSKFFNYSSGSLEAKEVVHLDQIDSKFLNERFRYIDRIRHDLRSRFRNEYLAELVHMGKTKFGSLKVGDIVLVEGAGKERFSWPIGKIEEMYFGKDGACRVVKLKTATGCLIHPLQKLFLLETGKNDEEKKPEQEQEIRKSRYGRILKRRTP